MTITPIHVAVAAVVNQNGQVLVAKRNTNAHQGDKWEFPGGKMEAGESIQETLIRELSEEINIIPIHYRPLIRITYQYPEKRVLLDTWQVTAYSGIPRGREGQPIMWKMPSELKPDDFPPANIPIIHALQIPDCCFITPDYTGDKADYLALICSVLRKGVKLIQFRSHALERGVYLDLAYTLDQYCRDYGTILMLNTYPDILQDMHHAQGVHLSSARLFECKQRPLPKDKWFSASCHSEQEIRHALELDVDFILISPVKHTHTHSSAEPLGWEKFAAFCELSTVPVYALGGMHIDDIPKAQSLGAQGIAAIRAFIN